MEFASLPSDQNFFDMNMLTNDDFDLKSFEDMTERFGFDEMLEDSLSSEPSTVSEQIKSEPMSPLEASIPINEANSPPPAVVPNNAWAYEGVPSKSPTIIYPEIVYPGATIVKAASTPTNGQSKTLTKSPPQIVSYKPIITATPMDSSNSIDVQAIKRQQRMIKNRESASLSRKKKKEYVQKLEQEIRGLETLIKHLRMENNQLKKKLSQFLPDVQNLFGPTKFSTKDKTKLVTLTLAVSVLFLCFNIFPNLVWQDTSLASNSKIMGPLTHKGRSLLWEPETNDSMNVSDVDYFLSNISNNLCPNFANKTEAARIENQIRCWLHHVEKDIQRKQNKVIPKLSSAILLRPSWVKERRVPIYKKLGPESSSNAKEFALQLYKNPRNHYDEFFDSIHRRNDTFYFVSFSGDHLLFPATIQNRTGRPRMSMVMPAMIFNESTETQKNYVTMMQIDCEVFDTKYVYVKESALPPYFKTNQTKEPLINYRLLRTDPHSN